MKLIIIALTFVFLSCSIDQPPPAPEVIEFKYVNPYPGLKPGVEQNTTNKKKKTKKKKKDNDENWGVDPLYDTD